MDVPAGIARRDVAAVPWLANQLLLQSIDASASIGSMALDELSADPEEVGYWVTRTACLEVITLGGLVTTLALAVAQQADADAVRAGAQRFCIDADVSPEVVLSSENYMTPAQSSISASAAGVADSNRLVLKPPIVGTLLCTVGRPYNDGPISTHDAPPMSDLRQVISDPATREVIPVGSRGVAHDLASLGVTYELVDDANSLRFPAGPGRLMLVLCDTPLDIATFAVIGRVTGRVRSETASRRQDVAQYPLN